MLLFQLHLAQCDVSKSTSNEDSDEDSYDETDGPNDDSEINESDHLKNCTFNGTTYFDDECAEWMRNFYIILTLTVAGMALYLALFLFCRTMRFFKRDNDFVRLIDNDQLERN